MRAVQTSHLVVLFVIFALTSLFLLVRMTMVGAAGEYSKPTETRLNTNVVHPPTGENSAEAAFDFDRPRDEKTFAKMYFAGSESATAAYFYDFADLESDLDLYALSFIGSFFEGVNGDDSFVVQYSASGNVMCSDAGSRAWVDMGVFSEQEGRLTLSVPVEASEISSLCVRVIQRVQGDPDEMGYQFADSASLNVYDIWVEPGVPKLEHELLIDADAFALEEEFLLKMTVRNTGVVSVDSIAVQMPISTKMDYLGGRASAGQYDYTTGEWMIGSIAPGEEALLDVRVKFARGFVSQTDHITSILRYSDDGEEVLRGTTVKLGIAPVEAAVPLVYRVAAFEVPEMAESISSESPDRSGGSSELVTHVLSDQDAVRADEQVFDSTQACARTCENSAFYLFIEDSQGQRRHTISEYVRAEVLGDRQFKLSFELDDMDADFDEAVFLLDVRDCRAVKVDVVTWSGFDDMMVGAEVYSGDELISELTVWGMDVRGARVIDTYQVQNYCS